MKLYVDDNGQWYTTAAEAPEKARQIEVPWEKKETLAAWLSELAVLKLEQPREPEPWELKRAERKAELERSLGIEEEIQSCDLPRLAVLASNVAHRFAELAKKGESK